MMRDSKLSAIQNHAITWQHALQTETQPNYLHSSKGAALTLNQPPSNAIRQIITEDSCAQPMSNLSRHITNLIL